MTEEILCACGCGGKRIKTDSQDRDRKFIWGHNRRSGEADRFLSKISARGVDECWIWIGAKFKSGYGEFRDCNSKKIRSHRFSYKLFVGEIPQGMCVLHKCDNRICVNPYHLFIGTQVENISGMVSKNRQAKGENHGRFKNKRSK